mgnify:CR=1 FL=1|tara:strand:- start:18 stop:7868 length:7851 start_codon:yes stop_codon:yes gene_type:complete
MAELKRNFSQAKMNKDLDERVLPAGQYRDANNVQVSTSDGSDVGSLQTLLGNTNVTEETVYTFIDPTISKVVGVKTLPEKDKIYFMVYSGSDVAAVPVGTPQKDYIVEYDTNTKSTDFAFVDIHTVKHAVTTACDDGTKVFKIKGGDQSWAHGIRIGMNLSGTFNDGSGSTVNINSTWNVKVTKIRYFASYWWIHHDYANAVGSSVGDILTVSAPRVLKFNPHNVIHSIDVTSDMLFWTDNQNEPRKIHLERSMEGTGGTKPLNGRSNNFYHNTMPSGVMTNGTFAGQNTGLFHTRLVKRSDSTSTQLVLALNRTKDQPIWVKEDHITVIKKSPTNPLSLKMFSSKADRTNTDDQSNEYGTENAVFATTTSMDFYSSGDLLVTGDTININFQTEIDLRPGDILMLTNDPGVSPSSFAVDLTKVRVTVQTIPNAVGPGGPPNNISTGTFQCIVNSIDSAIGNLNENWSARLEQQKPMFEFKFPRFSYRWKYQDGEYSTFAPWSEVAFMPGDFDYLPKKGFNLGMSNRLRYLTLENYFPEWGSLPEDVIEVDLLYKEAGKKTVYTVKTLKPQDGDPIWPDFENNYRHRGEFELTSELIHAVVPSNQLLRPWDNVPRLAKTQVMTGNRLVYGNYTQNYNIDESLVLSCGLSSRTIADSGVEDEEIPKRSVKSIRNYQIGVVWSDKYGRETPVMVPKTGGSVTIDKEKCVKQNWLFGKIKETVERPPWAEFVSYYVKETSNEYYNIAMDRFYNAEDGNVWISFPSAERNKIQQDTYLYLKKAHDGNLPVIEKARYRVIAVEDDAPLFIKAKKQSYGFETVEFINSGLPEEGRKYVIIKGSDFDNIFKSTIDPVRLDNLQARIGGADGSNVLISDLYDIVNIADSGSNKKIVFTKRLGAECGPISVLDASSDMKLEILHNKFENKPEFDGRFFVKILKDLTLEKELLSTMTTQNDYGVTDTLNLGFGCGGHGMDYNHWHHWKERRGAYNTTGSKFFIDDIDTYEDWDGITSNINSGGIFNYGGNGVIDISYSGFTHDDLESRSDWKRITDYFKKQGQLFRFKQDPAQVVFKVEGYRSRLYQNQNHGNHGMVPDGGAFKYYGGSWNGMTGSPMIGPNNDSAWNFDNNTYSWRNNRAGFRIVVDKQFGSSASHLMDNSTMAPMSKPDANGDMVPIADGERYDGAIVGGTVTTAKAVADTSNGQTQSNAGKTNVWSVGDFHNWYPITSNTGVYLNTANQLKRAQEKWHRLFEGAYDYNHSPLDPNNPGGVNWPGVSESAGGSSQRYGVLHAEAFHAGNQDAMSLSEIEFLEPIIIIDGDGGETFSSTNPAIWETEPKEDIGLDIYYEASAKIPLNPDHSQNELLIPIGSKVYKSNFTTLLGCVYSVNSVDNRPYLTEISLEENLTSALSHGEFLKIERPDKMVLVLFVNNNGGAASGQKKIVVITGENAINLAALTGQTVGSEYTSERAPWHNPTLLPWSNCWSFGNGVESDRVRDDYNAPQLDNGVKASTTLATPYEEELRSSGMIFSGIFNSTSGVNDLNQFIMAEPITKDINPSYGTIQRMYARNTNTLVFCEDKVLNILTNKDAVFNADGNTNITASNKVLGNPTPIPGDYGISTNPESLAIAPNAMYWCDPVRGKVLKLEGNTTIKVLSDVGMSDYFNDTLMNVSDVIGTYDQKKKDYNISIGKKVAPAQVFSTKTTITYSEVVQGWTSFKAFQPEMGISLNNEYYTFKNGQMWQHHVSESLSNVAVLPNNFYGTQYYPDVTLIFNDQHSSVKSFNLINYEGTQSRITAALTDPEYYNLTTKTGWYVDNMHTDLQEVGQLEFKSKEGKWFSTVKGVSTDLSNLDEREFSVQGLGVATTNTTGNPTIFTKLTVQPNGSSASGTNWDASADSSDWGYTGTLTQTISSGTVYSAGYKDAILHNVVISRNGQLVYSGLDLDAASFSVPGATVTAAGVGSARVYTHTAKAGWNADTVFSTGDTVSDGITKVEFTNIGIAGDPGNEVRARIYYHGFTAGTTQKQLFVDIDNGGTVSSGGDIYRNACIKVHYNQTANNNSRTVTVAQTDVAGITETNIDQFDPNGHAEKSNEHEATNGVLQGVTTKLAEYTITCGASEYLSSQSNGKGAKTQYHGHSSAAPWQTYYSYSITDTYHTSTGNTNKIKSSKVEVFYTPPVGVLGLDPDPTSGEGGWCTFMQCVDIVWLAREIVANTNTTSILNTMSFMSPSTNGSQANLTLSSTSAGNVGVILKRGNNYYTLTPNTSGHSFTGVWGEGEQSEVVNNIFIDSSLNLIIPVNHTTSNTLSTVQAWNVVTTLSSPAVNLTLSASCPTQSSPSTTTQQNLQSSSILVAAKTNTVRVPTIITNAFTAIPGPVETVEGANNVLTKTVSITYTAGSGNTIAIDRQPVDSDITGGGQTAELVVGSSGGTQLTVSNADAIGLTTGMVVTHLGSTRVLSSNASIAQANKIAFSTADYNSIVVGETVTGGNVPANTTVASKAIVSGNNIVTLSNSETTSSPSGTSYVFSGLVVPGTTISSIATPGTDNTNITISTAILGLIAQFQEVKFGNGYSYHTNLTAVMVETSTSSGGVITTVQNKKCLITGTITITNVPTTASNFTINPNFLTVS